MEPLSPDAIARCSNIPEMFERLGDGIGTMPAFVQDETSLTFAELWDQSSRLGGYLQAECGIGRDDKVAVMLPNMLAFPIVCLAILRIGAVQVNVNPSYVARELAHQLSDSAARAIIVIGAAVATLRDADPPELHSLIVVGASAAAFSPAQAARWRITDFAAVLAQRRAVTPAPATRTALAFLQYTGGTTGRAKGAMLSHGNILANVEQFRRWTDGHLRWGQVTALTAIPLYHIFALTVNMFAVAALGGRNVLIRDPRNLALLCDEWQRHRVNFFTGVNTMFTTLGQSERFAAIDFQPGLLAMGGGAAIHRAVSERWRDVTGRHIIEGYGLSETSPILTCTPFDETEFRSSIGFAFPGTTIAIRDDAGGEVAPGGVGELCAMGPQVMQGYWRQPEATAAAMTADGLFRTGDLARRGADGRYHLVDRRKDMILVSGFNVYPNEVEETVGTLAGVAECACVGVPDPRTGEAVALYIVAHGRGLSAEDVVAHCRASLAPYKIPRHIVFIDALPKSAVGKILRRELRVMARVPPAP